MKQTILILTVLLTAVAAMGQTFNEHQNIKPTASQCKADHAAWSVQMLSKDKLPLTEVARREEEMGACLDVLSSSYDDQSQAWELMMIYGHIIETREKDFLKRHNLLKQFQEEEANEAR